MSSWMEKGFWVAAGGLAGFVIGGMLFDDDEPRVSRKDRNLATDRGESEEEEAESARIEASKDDNIAADWQSQTIKETMERIGLSLDETMEALKPKTVKPEEA